MNSSQMKDIAWGMATLAIYPETCASQQGEYFVITTTDNIALSDFRSWRDKFEDQGWIVQRIMDAKNKNNQELGSVIWKYYLGKTVRATGVAS